MAVNRVRTGVIFIALGGLLLLNTTGVLDFRVWESMLVLWPLLLIAIGIEKIFASTKTLKPLAYLSPLIILGTVVYAVLGSPEGAFTIEDRRDRKTTEWSVSGDSSIERVTLDMDFGGGRLNLRGGASADQVLEGQFHYTRRRPEMVATQSGETMDITIRPRSGKHIGLGDLDRERWILRLTETIPVNLKLEAGGAQVRLDLEEVMLENLNLSTGAADIDLILGALSPEVDCDIECGAASIEMVIPKGAGVRIERETALSSLSTGSLDLVRRGDRMETPDFDSSPVRITLRIDAGVSSFRIRESGRSVGIGETI